MGDQNTRASDDDEKRLDFTHSLLNDIRALERMIREGKIETGITRIGAEQEFCLLNENWRPADNATDILAEIDDEHFTTELAKYNLEINLDPIELTGDAFSKVEEQLTTLLAKAKQKANRHNSKILLTGILPTISPYELGMDFMTPMPRYYALNEMMTKLRGTDFRLHLSGVDELAIKHNSVMFEACNTSFQMHLQIQPNDFARSYNWAQAISGPVLGICVNSPLLLGRELWSETRIALFQQSIDTRGVSLALKDQPSRVDFGNDWIKGSIADIFKNELSQHKIILSKDIEEDSLQVLKAGGTPKLKAINLHNGTIYRWNRACYGVGGGKAHVRIENRYIPSGPTVLDEMANFAFWVGLMVGRPTEFDDLPHSMDFKDAKSNFKKAARNGSESIMTWKGKNMSLNQLILDELLPIAEKGLKKMRIIEDDIDRFLGVIKNRAKAKTGAQWITENYRNLKSEMKPAEALVGITKSIYENQQNGNPVHDWPETSLKINIHESAKKIGHIMSTQIISANMNDSAEFILSIMKWRKIHHLPIVDQNDSLVGLLTWTHLQRYSEKNNFDHKALRVSEIMVKNVQTVETSTRIPDAIKIMKEKEIGCLPVIQNEHLVRIITIRDVLKFDHD